MAKIKSTPRICSVRNSQTQRSKVADQVADSIETERRRLMSAEAILHCLELAMDEEARAESRRPHYQSVVALARKLVADTINNLEMSQLKQAVEKSAADDPLGVKEPCLPYLQGDDVTRLVVV